MPSLARRMRKVSGLPVPGCPPRADWRLWTSRRPENSRENPSGFDREAQLERSIGGPHVKAVVPAGEAAKVRDCFAVDGRAGSGRNKLSGLALGHGAAGAAAGPAGLSDGEGPSPSAASRIAPVSQLPDNRFEIRNALLEFRHGRRIRILGMRIGVRQTDIPIKNPTPMIR